MKIKSKCITISGLEVRVFNTGEIEKANKTSGRLRRSFGSNANGYRLTRVGDKTCKVHRLVAIAFISDYSERMEVDHINGDRSDNRLENLRMVTHRQNLRSFNRGSMGKSSSYRGVSLFKTTGQWRAQIQPNGKCKHLGLFDSEDDAAMAYNEAARIEGYSEESLNKIRTR